MKVIIFCTEDEKVNGGIAGARNARDQDLVIEYDHSELNPRNARDQDLVIEYDHSELNPTFKKFNVSVTSLTY